MTRIKTASRIGIAVVGAAAVLTFGMTGPVQAAGANDSCTLGAHAYCPTVQDPPESQNGKGEGKATGRPDAGTVGKADEKNPPGQFPNGRDSNAGYECDRNQGVGQSNPAHTGCTFPGGS